MKLFVYLQRNSIEEGCGVTIGMPDTSRQRRSKRRQTMGEDTGMTGTTNSTGKSVSGSKSSTNDTRGDTTGDSDSSMSARGGDATFVPFGIVEDAVALTGAFQYGENNYSIYADLIFDCLGTYTCLSSQGEEVSCFVLLL